MLPEVPNQRGHETRTVAVGPFRVLDLDRSRLAETVAETAVQHAGRRPTAVFALHVGGLNARRDSAFVGAMNRADLVYADGGSAVLLAKLAGARDIQRAVTTDVGWEFIGALFARLGRPVRVALVGGPEGLSAEAAKAIERGGPAEVVATEHGYHTSWGPVLARLRAAAPDVVVVGLGAPGEMLWVDAQSAELPTCLVLTCGGWFGYLVGDELRAPSLLRHAGLEWIARFAQAPRRLGPRYARGAVSTATLAVTGLRSRLLRRRSLT